MPTTFTRILCRVLAVCLIALPLQASAGLVGTTQAIGAAAAHAQRDRLASFLQRSDVVRQLEAYGLSGEAAAERVASLSDAEVASLAGQVEQAPAGGASVGVAVLVALALFILWTVYTTSPKTN
jgi:hypothetical protein